MPYTPIDIQKKKLTSKKKLLKSKNGGLNQDGERPRESILLKTLLRREEP